MRQPTTAEALVRASVEAYNRHDLDGCIALLAPDATWEVLGMGPPLNVEELRIALWQYFVRDSRVEIRTLAAVGPRVYAEYTQSYTEDDQHRRLVAPIACVYELADGLIARVRQYYHPSWERPQGNSDAPPPTG